MALQCLWRWGLAGRLRVKVVKADLERGTLSGETWRLRVGEKLKLSLEKRNRPKGSSSSPERHLAHL